jgi:hypothetical protein
VIRSELLKSELVDVDEALMISDMGAVVLPSSEFVFVIIIDINPEDEDLAVLDGLDLEALEYLLDLPPDCVALVVTAGVVASVVVVVVSDSHSQIALIN